VIARPVAASLPVAVAATVLATPVGAHHSAALFDAGKQVSLEGVVTKYDWRNPHVYMAMRIAGADGRELEQEIEAGASSVLLPLGLTPDAVKIGERVTVRGNPSRSGPGHMVLGRELLKADGSVLPLNINSAASRAAPQNVTATSIAGTWFPQRESFFAFGNSRRSWALTDEGQKAAAAFSGRATAHADCIPVTAPTLMLYPVTSVIEVGADVVKLHIDWMSSERVVYLDGRGHPANGAPTLHGHSIGRWDGQTLVVDTVQFSAHREGNAMGLASGTRKHLVERFSVSDDGKHLRYDVVLEDPDYLAAAVTYGAQSSYRPDLVPTGLACDLDVARRFLTQD
jgi:hypothetical protein